MNSNSLPDVSVVMSVYNGSDQLNQTIESILLQERVSLEFIIIDDGSTDNSSEILNNYASRDARIFLLRQENKGLTRALIKGCNLAKGKYIARQDAGDISAPGRLRLQKAILDQDEQCAFVSCWTSVIGPSDEYLFTNKGNGLARSPIHILSEEKEWGVIDGPTHHGSVMFRKGAYLEVGGYREAFYYGQDWDLWYRLAALGKFATVEQDLYRGRITPGSISSLSQNRQNEYARLSRKAHGLRVSDRSDVEVLREAERLFSQKARGNARFDEGRAMYFIGRNLANNNDPRATRYLLAAVLSNPFLLRAWLWAVISMARHPSSVTLNSDAR